MAKENETVPLKRIVFDNIVTSSSYLKLAFDSNIALVAKVPTITSDTGGGDSDNNAFYNFTPYDCKDYDTIVINTLDGSTTDFKPSVTNDYKNRYTSGTYYSNADGTTLYDDSEYLSSSYRYCDYIDTNVINVIKTKLSQYSGSKKILPRLGSKIFNFKTENTNSSFNYQGIKSTDEFAALCNPSRISSNENARTTRAAVLTITNGVNKEGIFLEGTSEEDLARAETKTISILKYPFSYLNTISTANYILDFKNDEITENITFTNNIASSNDSFFNNKICKFPTGMNKVTVSTNALERMYMGNNFITSLVSLDLPTLSGLTNSNINLKNTFESCTNLAAVDLDRWNSFKIYDTDCTFKNTKVAYNPYFLGSHSNKETFNNSVPLPANTELTLTAATTYESILAGKTNPSIKSIHFNHSGSIPADKVKTIFGSSTASIGAISCSADLTGTSTSKLFSTGAVTVGYIPSKLLNSMGDNINAVHTDSNTSENATISINSNSTISFGHSTNSKTANGTFINVGSVTEAMSTNSVNLTQQSSATFSNTITKNIECSTDVPTGSSVTVNNVSLVATNAVITRYGDNNISLATLTSCTSAVDYSGNTVTLNINSSVSNIQDTNSIFNFGGVVKVNWSGTYNNTPINGTSYIDMAKSILIKKLDLVTAAIYRVNADGTLTPEYTNEQSHSGTILIPFSDIVLNENKDSYTLYMDTNMLSGQGTITVTDDNIFTDVIIEEIKVSIKSIGPDNQTSILGENTFNKQDIMSLSQNDGKYNLNIGVTGLNNLTPGTTVFMTSETKLNAKLGNANDKADFTLKDSKVIGNN